MFLVTKPVRHKILGNNVQMQPVHARFHMKSQPEAVVRFPRRFNCIHSKQSHLVQQRNVRRTKLKRNLISSSTRTKTTQSLQTWYTESMSAHGITRKWCIAFGYLSRITTATSVLMNWFAGSFMSRISACDQLPVVIVMDVENGSANTEAQTIFTQPKFSKHEFHHDEVVCLSCFQTAV